MSALVKPAGTTPLIRDFGQEARIATDFALTRPAYARKVLGDAVPAGQNLSAYLSARQRALQEKLIAPVAKPTTQWYTGVLTDQRVWWKSKSAPSGNSLLSGMGGGLLNGLFGSMLGSAAFTVDAGLGGILAGILISGTIGGRLGGPGAVISRIGCTIAAFYGITENSYSISLGGMAASYGAGVLVSGAVHARAVVRENLAKRVAEKAAYQQALATQAATKVHMEQVNAQAAELTKPENILQTIGADLELTRHFFDDGVRGFITKLKGEAEANLGTAQTTYERLAGRLAAREAEYTRTKNTDLALLIARLRATLAMQDGTVASVQAEIERYQKGLVELDAHIGCIDTQLGQEANLSGLVADYRLAGDTQQAQVEIDRAQAMRQELLLSLDTVIREIVQEAGIAYQSRMEIAHDVDLRLAAAG